jgi:hypothetical protein
MPSVLWIAVGILAHKEMQTPLIMNPLKQRINITKWVGIQWNVQPVQTVAAHDAPEEVHDN